MKRRNFAKKHLEKNIRFIFPCLAVICIYVSVFDSLFEFILYLILVKLIIKSGKQFGERGLPDPFLDIHPMLHFFDLRSSWIEGSHHLTVIAPFLSSLS
jgi:hypothetical protein